MAADGWGETSEASWLDGLAGNTTTQARAPSHPPPPYSSLPEYEAEPSPPLPPPPASVPAPPSTAPPPYDSVADAGSLATPELGAHAARAPTAPPAAPAPAGGHQDHAVVVGGAAGFVAAEAPGLGPDRGAQGVPQYHDPRLSPDSRLCVEVRLPPMRPREAANPKILVAGFNSLFALPGLPQQAMLQWAEARTQLVVPQGAPRATQEDVDMAAGGVVPLPDGLTDGPTAARVDELRCCMWTGHRNGRVVQWSLAHGHVVRAEQVWKAHSDTKIRALAVTPWGDLWTGSSQGSISVWSLPSGIPGVRTPVKTMELKKPGNARPHGNVVAMACGSSGRCVWSVGQTSALLWDAHSGSCLGALRLSGIGQPGFDPASGLSWIDPAQGIDASWVRSTFTARHPPGPPKPSKPPTGGAENEEASSDEEGGADDVAAAALARVAKGVSSVGKFAAFLGKKINKTAAAVGRNLQERTAAGAGYPAGGGAGDMDGEDTDLRGDPASSSAPAGSAAAGPAAGMAGGAAAGGSAAGSVGSVKGKLKALLPALDGSMVLVYKGGRVEVYTELGRLLWALDARTALLTGLLVGRSVWLGCGDGHIAMLDASTGALQARWPAHHAAVRSLAAVGVIIYSLANDGSIRGWPAIQPPPPHYVTAWKDGLRDTLRCHALRILAGTWNVNVTRPQPASIQAWLGPRADAADLVCVGLQEVEVGTGSVAMEAALSLLNKGALERGNSNAQWWAEQLLHALGGPEAWARVALRQMSGVLVFVFCRAALAQHVGEITTTNVTCGLMGVAGNKGAVAVSLSLFRRRLVFLSSHFAAHQEKVEERIADYTKIVRTLRFANTSCAPPAVVPVAMPMHVHAKLQRRNGKDKSAAAPATASSTAGPARAHNAPASNASDASEEEDVDIGGSSTPPQAVSRLPSFNSAAGPAAAAASPLVTVMVEHGAGLRDADALIWMGDFNFRVQGPYDWVVERCSQLSLSELVLLDQCRQEMARGTVFQALAEGPLSFLPTYKFDKQVPHSVGADGQLLLPYDSSEKRRVPAWTDRILWRGSLPCLPELQAQAHPQDAEEAVQLMLLPGPDAYSSSMAVCDSDHKPVWACLEVQLPAYVQEAKRRHSMQVLAAMAEEITPTIPVSLQVQVLAPPQPRPASGPGDLPVLQLAGSTPSAVRVINTCPSLVHLLLTSSPLPGPGTSSSGGGASRHAGAAPDRTSADGSRRAAGSRSAAAAAPGVPLWLDVQPPCAVLPPGGWVDVMVRGGAAPGPVHGADGARHGGWASLETQDEEGGVREAVLLVVGQHLACAGSGALAMDLAAQQGLLAGSSRVARAVQVVHTALG